LGAVISASRAPDGSVLGLGNITSLVVGADGQNVWIARFAANAITVLRTSDGSTREVSIGSDHDADRLALAQDQLWFTVNSGPGGRLAAAVGHLNTQSLNLRFLPIFARSLTIRPDGVHALGDTWARIDPLTDRVTSVMSLTGALDSSTETVDATGNLVARGAGQTKLFIVSPQGGSRTISYEQGSFVTSAGTHLAMNSPLAFATTDAANTLWFAPRGGPTVFAVP
jgi:streptogramin lyase